MQPATPDCLGDSDGAEIAGAVCEKQRTREAVSVVAALEHPNRIEETKAKEEIGEAEKEAGASRGQKRLQSAASRDAVREA